MATNPDKLTPKQEAALELLVIGKSVTETAAAVGVARQSVSEWLNQHAVFRAAYNARREELWGAAADRLRALVPRALEVIEERLRLPGGVHAAIAVLKAAGLHGVSPDFGPTTAEAVRDEQLFDGMR